MLFGCEPPPIKVNLPNSRWEPIFFKEIDRVTALAKIKELRKVNLNKNNIQVRIWRSAGPEPLEGALIQRLDGQWSGKHIREIYREDAEQAEIKDLRAPKNGWPILWQTIVDKGLLTLPDPSEINCEDNSVIDGTSYVVEINQDNSYRTYRYGGGKCPENQRMEYIGEIIGLEFDTGQEKCTRTEWFPCMTLIRSRKLSP